MQIREITIETPDGKEPSGFRKVTFKVAPTPLYIMAECRPLFSSSLMESAEGLRALAKAIYWGARRAESQVTLDWLEQNIDMHNWFEVYTAWGEINGMTFTKGGAKAGANGAAGEPVAAGSTGSTTSPSSPPTS